MTTRLTSPQIRPEPGKDGWLPRPGRARIIRRRSVSSCLLCLFVFCSALTDCARCNDIQIGGVICQVHFASGLTPGRSVHCVRKKKKGITCRLYLQSNFIPPATRGGLSAEPCLAFKCGKSAQSPPLTRNATRLSSWCSLNKLNNEGISEMPERHYTPTIRARSE